MTTPLDPIVAQIIPLLPLRDPETMSPQSARDALRPTMARFAPRAASTSAAAKPMPLVAPVIRICLSFTAQQSKASASRGWRTALARHSQ